MTSITVSNVDEALPALIRILDSGGVVDDSRNGKVLTLYSPISVTFLAPWERFVMHPVRRSNVAFLVMEGLWMLAGRRDVFWISRFNEQMKAYSDNEDTFHGAYGHRLRSCGRDQLSECAAMLKLDPTTRRAVAQIWDADSDLGSISKDIPCNDLIMFRVMEGRVLDMTVCNRSNDLVWGMCGANAAHFSMIHEYVAAKAGLVQGRWTQFSNNLHMYLDTPRLDQLRKIPSTNSTWYSDYSRDSIPLVGGSIEQFDRELRMFMAATEVNRRITYKFTEPFFETVAKPLFNYWVSRKYLSFPYEVYLEDVKSIADQAIQVLALQWISEDKNETV